MRILSFAGVCRPTLSHAVLSPSPVTCSQPARNELSRVVVGRGTVVRHLRDGTTQMLFVTGKMRASVVSRRRLSKLSVMKFIL